MILKRRDHKNYKCLALWFLLFSSMGHGAEVISILSNSLEIDGTFFRELKTRDNIFVLSGEQVPVFGKKKGVSNKNQGVLSLLCYEWNKKVKATPKDIVVSSDLKNYENCYDNRDEYLDILEKNGVVGFLNHTALASLWRSQKKNLFVNSEYLIHLFLKKKPFLILEKKNAYLVEKLFLKEGKVLGVQAVNLSSQLEYRKMSGVYFPLIHGTKGFNQTKLLLQEELLPLERVFLREASGRYNVFFLELKNETE